MTFRFAPLTALLLGVLSAMSFQPVGWWPLMIVSIAVLAELTKGAPTLRRALFVGWMFGVGQFTLGLNWIATAFTFQAAMPAWLGWVAVVLLSLYLAAYPMLAVGLAWRFGKDRPLALVLALAGSWALTEWLRATMFTGFSWNPLGVTLVDTPWRGASAYVGTYGLSALVVLAGGFLWMLARREWKPALAFAAVAALLLALPRTEVQPCCLKTFDVATAPKAVGPHFTAATGRIRVIQPNIGQGDKWRDGFDQIAAARLNGLSKRADPAAPLAGPNETVFWPEAAVTAPLVDERTEAAPFVAAERTDAVKAIGPGQLLATGGLALLSSDRRTVTGATNSVFVLDSGGMIVGRYDKAHLVPYGEYLPMRPILSAIGLSRLAPGDMDFRPGPGPQTLHLPNGRKMGVQICYEIIFSGQVVDRADRPDYLFNPSNDAWFGSWGPPQHLAQARLRAAEEAMPILRSTPTGVSAVIDARGGLVASARAGLATAIDTALPSPAPPTFFSSHGNLIPLAIGFLLLIAAIALGRRGR